MNTDIIPAAEIKRQIARVITPEDEVVVVFSGVWMFGSCLGKTPKDLPGYLIDLLVEILGPERTLVFPAYTYGYTSTRKFDLAMSRPETGALPVASLSHPNFRRTKSPLNSYLVAGPRSEEALGVRDRTLWSDESLMGWFDKVNARICVLGEPWHTACTHFHRAEEILQVPYRYYKRFPGAIYHNDNLLEECRPAMFVRPLNCPMKRVYTGPAKIMHERDMILSSDHPDFPMETALARDIVKACVDLLSSDRYAYIENKAEVKEWVEREKERELVGLRADERF